MAGLQTTVQKSPKKIKIGDGILESVASTVLPSIADINKLSVGPFITVVGKVTPVSDAEEVHLKQSALVKQNFNLVDASGAGRVNVME